MSRRAFAVLAVGAVLAGGGVYGYGNRGGGSSGGANIWVNTSAGASPSRCSPACAYDPTHAYGSFDAARDAASDGDTVCVQAGSYGAQDITGTTPGTSGVSISACGASVSTGAITVETNYLTVNGFNAGNNAIVVTPTGSTGTCTRTNVTISNNTVAGTNAGINGGCDHITISGNDVSGNNACTGGPEDALQFYSANGFGDYILSNITVTGNYIHDMAHAEGACGAHADGIQSFGCQHCLIEGNRFAHDDTSDIIIYAPFTGVAADVQDITIQNNSFGPVDEAGHGVSIGGNGCTADIPTNVIVQNNTFWAVDTADINCSGGFIAATVRNNVFAVNDSGFVCAGAIAAFDYNTFASGGCGTHKSVCTPTFTDATHAAGNIDLSSSDSCAKGEVPNVGGTYPATDIHATARPQGTLVDAGADEVPGG